MSETVPESPPSPNLDLHNAPDLGSDLLLWRRKHVNVAILSAATATWLLMEVCHYNFVTVVSWAAMALVVGCFLWANVCRLLGKEAPDLSRLEIGEEQAMEHAKLLRQRAEEGLRFMLHLSCEREWFVFAGVVASLYLISVVAAHLDFPTICYIGILVGMTIPALYVKKERKIRELAEKSRMESQRLYSVIQEKLRRLENGIAGKMKKKEKKQE